MYGLVDCNNFYASCERLFQPKLNRLPIVVLSNNDGCVIARSNESKALGIKMGAPYFKFERIFNEHNVVVFSSNYTLYGDISSRVMRTLNSFTPNIEIYSIDEAFLDLGGFVGKDLLQYSSEIRETVWHNVGIPVCVGVAPSKTLAKSANHYAKKTQIAGVFCIDSESKREEVLRWQPLDDVWGIGRQHHSWLSGFGLKTAWDLAHADKQWIGKKMGVVGVRLVNELNGISCIPLEEAPPAKQAICTSRSFGENLTDKEEIRQSLATHITRCAEKLRAQQTCAGALQVFAHTNPWNNTRAQYHGSLTVPLLTATSDTRELLRYGMAAFDAIFKPGYYYKKSGAVVMDIVPAGQVQRSLFDTVTDRPLNSKLMGVLDKINGKHGQDTVRMGAAGFSKKWRLKVEHRSPCYTTRIEDILKVHI